MKNKKQALVIGAGFGGLATAALLAKQGYGVTVLEKNSGIGGRARVWQSQGFKFDMGPSWYMMPDVFERFFKRFKRKPTDFYNLVRLDPSYRIIFGKGDYLDLSADLQANLEMFERLEKGARQKLEQYLSQASYQYKVSIEEFLYKEYRSIFDFFTKRMLVEGRKLNVFQNMDSYTKKYFANERLRRILLYSMVFLGSDPKRTPAIYSVLNHCDFNLGVWYPDGGFGSVATAIQDLAIESGAEVKCNQDVKKIVVQDGKAIGVQTESDYFPADLVVANGDYHHVETALLDKKWQTYPESYWSKRTLAPSAFIAYLGINKKVPGLLHHSLYFAKDWDSHFHDIFDNPRWPEQPSYYICTPSKTDPSTAPEGHENLFLLVPLAPGLQDTPEIRENYFKKIIVHLEGLLGEDLQNHIVVKRLFSIKDFAADYHAYKGSAMGLAHTLMQTANFRPQLQSKKVSNLYFAGQYTHPGIGVPMTLISAEVVTNFISARHD